MSEPTPPRETPPAAPAKSKGKLGPLPWWGWAGIAIAVVAGVIIWRKNSASNASASQSGVGAPETVTPVPTGTGLTGSQYAALASQNAAIYEAILDLQGDKSKKKKGDEEEDEEKKKDTDRDDDSTGTSGPATIPTDRGVVGGPTSGPPTRLPKPPRGTQRLPNGRIVPDDHTTGPPTRKPRKTTQGGSNPPIWK